MPDRHALRSTRRQVALAALLLTPVLPGAIAAEQDGPPEKEEKTSQFRDPLDNKFDASQYLDYQIKYLQEASQEEYGENDPKAGRYFAKLAAQAAKDNRVMEVADLPKHWQKAAVRAPSVALSAGPRWTTTLTRLPR